MSGRPSVRRWTGPAGAALALGFPVAVLVGQFLSLYVRHHLATPVGYDTPKYIWRANLVSARGLSALLAVPIGHPNADRPGYPVLAEVFHAVFRLTPFQLSFVFPAVMPAVIGLGAGAFAVMAMNEPRWTFPAFALIVGGSLNAAVMAISHGDTLIVSGIVMAAAATALAAAGGERTIGASVFLLGGATLVHWNFVAVFLGILAVLAAVLFPESLAARRNGGRLGATPAGRLGAVVLGSVVLGGGALLLAPGGPQQPPPARDLFLRRMTAILPVYELPLTGPVAAAGALSLWKPTDPARRRALWFALIWCGSAAASAALLYLGAAVAAHRILGFAYALPLLGAAALVWAARAAWRSKAFLLRVAGAVVLVGGLALSAFATQRQWFRSHASLPPATFAQAATAGAYLDRYAPGRPTVVVIDGAPGLVPLAERVFRASVPADRIDTTLPYLGDPDRLLAGQPTLRGEPAFDTASRVNFEHLKPFLSKDPVVLMVSSLDRSYQALTRSNPSWVVAPGVAVISGPRPSTALAAAPAPRPIPARVLVLRAAAVLLLLSVVGVGWAWSLVPAGWFERLALAPAFGIAALSFAGVAADRLGMVFSGSSGIAVGAGAAAAGWATRILAVRVRRRAEPGRPPAPGHHPS